MCGLVGQITSLSNGMTSADLDAFEHAMAVNGFRGLDSTGAMSISKKGDLTYHKQIGDPWKFITSDEYKNLRNIAIRNGKAMIGHGRKATFGKVTVDNAHPFFVTLGESKNPTADIALVHNGTLERHGNQDIHKFDVDSLWMAHEIAEKGPKGLENVRGAIATMWYDMVNRKMHIFRNTERPLFFARLDNGNILINSENSVLAYLQYRFGWKINLLESFEPQKLYTVDLENTELSADTLPWTTEILKLPTTESTPWPESRLEDWLNRSSNKNYSRESRRDSVVPFRGGATRPDFVRLRNLFRNIADGSLTMIQWTTLGESKNEIQWWRGSKTASTYFNTPRPENDLFQATAGKIEDEIELLYKRGNESRYRFIKYYQPIPQSPFDEDGATTTSRLITDNIPVLTKMSRRSMKEESKKYAVSAPLFKGRINKWHHKTEDGQTVHNSALSSESNPFNFLCFGNEEIGYYYNGMEIIAEVIACPPKLPNEHFCRYLCKIAAGRDNGHMNDLSVTFYHANEYKVGDRVLAQVVSMRPALVQEFNEEGKRIYMTLSDIKDVGFYSEQEAAVVQATPDLIQNISECISEYDEEKVRRLKTITVIH